MSFFTGPPGLAGLRGHDHLAEEIGTYGRDFAIERLRWEDLQSYMFLLLLEVGASEAALKTVSKSLGG